MNPAHINQFIDRLRRAFEEGDAEVSAKQSEAANVSLLQEQYQAIARGDFAAFLETLAEDIEMEIVGPEAVPFVGKWQGREQVAEAVRKNFSTLEDQRPELLSVVAQGDTVVVSAHELGRVRTTGRSYDIHWVQFFTFRDGRVARFREVFDSEPMLNAVGRP